jgi:hypothetical protein
MKSPSCIEKKNGKVVRLIRRRKTFVELDPGLFKKLQRILG